MLRKEHIPYQISGGQSFFDKAEIKDLCAYLRVLANEDDDPAFIRAATTPRRGIGPQTLKVLGEYAGERDISLFQAMFEAGVETRLPENSSFRCASSASSSTGSSGVPSVSQPRRCWMA